MSVKWTGIGTVTGRMARARSGMKAGTVALAESHAGRAEGTMKTEAEWVDRTTQARQGLYGEAEATATATGARITLGGTAEHNVHLELGTVNMAPRPIIQPTAEVTAREASEDLIRLAQRFGG